MQIRTLIALGGGTSIVAVAMAAVAMHFAYADIGDAYGRSLIARDIGAESSNLSILTGEYLLYHGKRAEEQWLGIHESLDSKLSSYTDADNPEIVRLRAQHAEANEVFMKLIALGDHAHYANKTATDIHYSLEARLTTQLLTSLHTMVGVSSRMVDQLAKNMETTLVRMLKITISVFFAIFVLFAAGWVVMTRRISVPVAALRKDIDIIAAGNLNHQITRLHRDEIGSVAERINAMGKSLQDTLVSRDALKDEIVQRQAVEKELQGTLSILAQTNEELQQFVYSVSHDLRAPLRAINGFSEALREDYGDVLKGDAQIYLGHLCTGAQEMGNLIDDLLKLSRVTRGEIVMNETDLSAIADEVAEGLKKLETGRNGEFVIQPNVSAFADQRLMRVTLENLLGNAWKFSRHEPAARIEFGAREENGKVVCYVRDNGVGFDMAYVDKLFTPFQRLNQQDAFEGTGIGLSTVRRVIAHHGGRTWAEGAVGEGATFYFELSRKGEGP